MTRGLTRTPSPAAGPQQSRSLSSVRLASAPPEGLRDSEAWSPRPATGSLRPESQQLGRASAKPSRSYAACRASAATLSPTRPGGTTSRDDSDVRPGPLAAGAGPGPGSGPEAAAHGGHGLSCGLG